MANLPITVKISTPLPINIRDLPKLERFANKAAATHGITPDNLTMAQEGSNLVITYQAKTR